MHKGGYKAYIHLKESLNGGYKTSLILICVRSFTKLYHFSLTNMKQILLLIPFLLAVSAARHKEKKATLEDVERGYITTKARLSPPPAPKTPAKSPTQFGFVPLKTAATYAQKEPKIIYAQSDFTAGHQGRSQYNTIAYSSPQQYSPGASQYSPAAQQYSSAAQQYSPASQYSSSLQQPSDAQQYSTGIEYASKPEYTGAGQKQQAQTQNYYVPQGQQGHYLNNYDNLQYTADNSIDQGSQQYYNPQQYLYLQQYQAPSTSIQAVVDPKGGLQYIMYIPTYVPTQNADQTQNYENVVYSNNEQTYQQPESPRYTTYSEKRPSQYTTYTEKQNSYEVGKSTYTPKGEVIIKREPKSLIDSYVPSSVQLQYFKQAQAHLNSLQDSQKYGSFSPVEDEYNYKTSPFKR